MEYAIAILEKEKEELKQHIRWAEKRGNDSSRAIKMYKDVDNALSLLFGVVTELPTNEEINIESNKQATCINGMGNEYQNLSKYLGFVNCINWLKDKNKVKR